MQANPATVALVSLMIGVVATIAVFLLFLQVEDTRRALNPRTEPIENPCVSHQRVEGTKGRNCPRFFVPHRRGVVPQNPSTTGQRSGPRTGGGDTKKPRGRREPPNKRKPPRRTTPTPSPVEVAPVFQAPEEQSPGSSGDTPAEEKSQGVNACVDHVVSACVKVGDP